MDHHTPRPSNRNTFGEALIAFTALGGFLYAFSQGQTSYDDLWLFAGLLGVIVAFYFALLFARMLFYWMTGGDHVQYAWWEHEKHARQFQAEKKKK